MADSALTDEERSLLIELRARGVRFLVVGASAAILQGANTATQDIDLWFEDTMDPRIKAAVDAVGGIWVSGSFGAMPRTIGGEHLGDRLDVVVHMHGLRPFDVEFEGAKELVVDGVPIRVLPLDRIIASKRATGRARDRAQLPALEEALAATRTSEFED